MVTSHVVAFALAGALVLVGVGLNPFGSLGLDRPWSRCGQELCACEPIEAFCPLCPDGGSPAPGCGLGQCDESPGSGLALVRRAERLNGPLPMLLELLGASLVVRVGGQPIMIESPGVIGVVRCINDRPRGLASLGIDPPPPRGAGVLA